MKSSGANDVIQIAAKNATTVITTFQRRWTDTLVRVRDVTYQRDSVEMNIVGRANFAAKRL